MKITQLPASSNFASGDVLAIEVSGKTYKLTGATLAAALESIGDYVTTDDMASTSADGLMSASDKRKLNGIAAGAQVNTITGVKGGAEGSYRTGQVSLTPANIGAVAKTGDTMTGALILSAAAISDANVVDAGFTVLRCNGDTLHTPTTEGLTDTTDAFIISSVLGNFGTQYYYGNSRDIVYVRRYRSAVWQSWEMLVSPERRATYDMTVSVTGATIGARCAMQNFDLPSGVTPGNIKSIFVSKNSNGNQANVVPVINDTGKLYVHVYAAQATVSASITVTVVY